MPAKFTLKLNEKLFEYDIYNLIRAFYPLAEVPILYDGDAEPKGGRDAFFEIVYAEDQVSLTAGLTEQGSQYPVVRRDGKDYVRLESGDLWRLETVHASASITSREDRVQMKNEVKIFVYRILSTLSDKKLPWGDLTGIRPTKIAMQLLEAGKSDADILHTMQNVYLTSEDKAHLALATVKREKEALAGLHEKTGYSLYVGIPFCPSICLYCSFGSHRIDRFEKMVQPYLDALYRELSFISEQMQGWNLDSVYIGGGTPTSISAQQMRELLTVIRENFDLEHVAEFTVEAGRPDTITWEKLEVLREFPVSRISVNPQTMNQKTLDLIGRQHTVEETIRIFRMAREMGFDNINMDLIIGLPGEGEAEVRHTLEEIEKLDPDSLTIHSLALKRATRLNLFKDAYEPISFENSEQIMKATEETAHRMGMTPYYLYRQKNMAGNFENVGYAKAGKTGIYNILIMEERQSILAAGSGASTKFVFEDGARIERAENVKDLKNYMDRLDEMLERKRYGIDHYLKNYGEEE